MKVTFFVALLLGFVGVLAAGHFVPWGSHVRLPSQTRVVANGGRDERFVIRLPADRVAVAGANGVGLRADAAAGPRALPAALTSEPLLVEHFKIRDASGNVVGLAARHWSADARAAGTAWSLMLPSRGALLLTSPAEARGALDAALRRAGYNAGSAWTGDVRVAFTPADADTAVVAAGSDEFAGLRGRFNEVWTITGVSEGGELRGTIEIDTVTRQGS
ncbi:MAG TPA: hypothetical protein VMU03_02035 [Gammaproteobacteria bacterium]|nr:hypothetical protein [Gammaproteobacteria bacterium]